MDKSKSLPVVVIVCGDPGGAEAVAPVIQALQNDRLVQVRAFACREACDVWTRHNIFFESLSENLTIAQAGEKMLTPPASLLLSGTSYNNSVDLEKRFIAAAHNFGIPSLAVLDFWSNYLVRFQDSDGRLTFIPDRIAVMDQLAYNELTILGIDPNRLVITGQPAFDVLISWRLGFTLERRRENRIKLDIQETEILVLFASQPLAAVFGRSADNNPHYMGYDEFIVIKALLAGLEEIVSRHYKKITLLVRPHPRETTDWLTLLHSEHIRILVSSDMDRRDQAIAADIVTGMNSEMLVETCYIGCLTVSLQPGLRLPDALPTNRSGLSKAVYTFDEITPVIEQMLFDKTISEKMKIELKNHLLDDMAAQRVTNLVYKMMSIL